MSSTEREANQFDPDLAKAESFLSALDPLADYFTFQTFTDAEEQPNPDLLAKITTTLGPGDGRTTTVSSMTIAMAQVSMSLSMKSAAARARASM